MAFFTLTEPFNYSSTFTLTTCYSVLSVEQFGEKDRILGFFVFPGIWIVSIVFALPAIIYSHIRVIELDTAEIKVCYPFPSHLGSSYAKVIKSPLYI